MQEKQFELLILGTGAGASAIYDGLTSSSFMLCSQGQPFCLIDLGLGVGREVIAAFGAFPSQVVITHNHSDHAGDLAVVLRVELASGNKMKVIANKEVTERLQQHRIAEHLEQLTAEALADWVSLEESETVEIGEGLSIQFYRGVHSETSYGFVIRDRNEIPRLAYTGDSCLNHDLYENLSKAKVFLMDARPKKNAWHASFEEVTPWLKEGCYILGHGLNEASLNQEFAELPLLFTHQRVQF